MAFVNDLSEPIRLLGVALAALTLELVLLPGIVFELLIVSGEWSVPLQLLVVSLPRFAAMWALVLVFGPFQRALWFVGFLAAYLALLVVSFYRFEAFVDWSSGIAASQATVPYAAGVIGAVMGFLLIRSRQTPPPHPLLRLLPFLSHPYDS